MSDKLPPQKDGGDGIRVRADWDPPEIDPTSVQTGDMPGDQVKIGSSHVEKANTIFPYLLQKLKNLTNQKFVVSVYGGSGVGKSEIGSVLGHYCNLENYPAYILSGDNYPYRIPSINDTERLLVYRAGGLSALARHKNFSNDWVADLQTKWPDLVDFSPTAFAEDSAWFTDYYNAGRAALTDYLGTDRETDFSLVNYIIQSFKNGAESITLKRMGRTIDDMSLEAVDFSDINVLIVEWTHGNNPNLEGVDFPVYLFSTPAETLAHRLARARDKNTDTPFISLVLEIEQEKLINQADRAGLILSRDGEILSLADLQQRLNDQ